MKNKNVFVLIIFILVFLIITFPYKKEQQQKAIIKSDDEKRAVFISYIEEAEYFKNKSKEQIKKNIDHIVETLALNNFNMIILHVRPFGDAIYDSKIFPSSLIINKKESLNTDFDVLKYFISSAHQKNIELHAWINPYRIRNNNDISTISNINPAYKWIKENSNNVEIKEGIYYNPASSEVLDLIIRGIEEIVLNYEIDGIHFDDYFYPSKTIDLKNYEEYKNDGGTLSLNEYRYNNIYQLLSKTNKTIKTLKPEVEFGISPAGNIENNINNEYLNIKYILENTNYLDYIMPQIYFGFNNSSKPFIDTVKEWNDLIDKNTKLYIALAPYKIGIYDKYAGQGKDEWINSTNILARQIIYSRTIDKYKGFSLFRYDFVFNEKNYQTNTKIEIQNVFKLFNIS